MIFKIILAQRAPRLSLRVYQVLQLQAVKKCLLHLYYQDALLHHHKHSLQLAVVAQDPWKYLVPRPC